MRDNGLVGKHEIEVRDDQLIISRTDEHGRILFINPDFLEISGYSEEELIGQPHNVVRHPDMPSAVFADFWRDIQAGRPWVGMLKNRCKNGDFYWVEAHVSPLMDGKKLSGYMSMRRKPTREQIHAAEIAYATLRDPAQNELSFKHGSVIRRRRLASLLGYASHDISLGTKFLAASLLAAILTLSAATYFIGTHITRTLDENARHQLTHDVSLLRAAVSSRIESANSETVGYAKTLSETIEESIGGSQKMTYLTLAALIDHPTRAAGLTTSLRELRGAASIFLLTRDGFQRRLSTAPDELGNPAIGSYLSSGHPAHEPLLAGQIYIGPARVFGRQYITRYTPIKDSAGVVIGASAVGIDIDDQLATLKVQIRAMQVGNSGYYYILDATPGESYGDLLLHPYKEGTNLADFRISPTQFLVAEMAQRRQGEISYAWKNEEAGETAPRKKLVIFETLDMPHWIIAGGTTVDEFAALTQSVLWSVIVGGLLLAGAILVTILHLQRKLVLDPLHTEVLPTFEAISAGQFDTPLDIRGNDEIAQLIQGLETLRNRIAFDNDRDRTLARMREAARLESEALAQARADFLANMSHEIRTPLNGVIGLSHLLRQSQLQPREMEYVRRIEGAGKLLLALVNDVLDFSKIDAGGMSLEEADFELDDVLDNLSSLLRSRVQEKKLILEYVVAPNVPTSLRGDALRLSQVLINLVGNAIKFTAVGGITLYVDCHHQSNDKIELGFRIQDTGIGISREQQAALFQPFTQADNSVTRKFGGTGLGLVITKRLIEMMGGSITIDSMPQVGSTFSFTVLLGVGQSAAHRDQPLSHRILVVDDHSLARTVLARLLKKHGCTVETDESASAALSRLRNDATPFDCIMIDLNMPGIDGLALAGMLRSKLGASTRLVMVTAGNPHATDLRGSLDVFDEIVEKPVTFGRIGEILAHLDSQPGHTQASVPEVDAAPLAGIRILVAEDVPTNQLIIRDLLESLGATIMLADNGQLAIEAFAGSSGQIDLILMDIQMPEMDGLEATRRIRAGSIRPGIPIIALTAHALENERQRARDAGMNGFLTKPIEPDQLLATIRRHADARSPQAAPAPAPAPSSSPVMAEPVAPKAAPPAAPSFPEMPGIDVADGLRRMLNKAPLYEKVLRDFHGRFTGEPERLRQALSIGDRETAARLAHSVKGTGGTIGAKQLSLLAKNLEDAIKAAMPEQTAHLSAFECELERVLGSIEKAFPSR